MGNNFDSNLSDNLPLGSQGEASAKSQQVYWPAREGKDCATACMQRIQEFRTTIEQTGIGALWRRSFGAYYGLDPSGLFHRSSSVVAGGEDGELLFVKINDFRNILQHVYTMMTQDEIVPEPRAINDEPQSTQDCEVARAVLQYETRAKNLDEVFDEITEWAIMAQEGYSVLDWDPKAGSEAGMVVDIEGKPVMDSNGLPQKRYDGDFVCTAFGPMDVIRDLRHKDFKWVILRRWIPKHDLAAQYPELADEILKLEVRTGYSDVLDAFGWGTSSALAQMSDDVAVYELRFERTPALQEGRFMRFCSGDVILDPPQPLPYPVLGVYRQAQSEMRGRGHGYTFAYDLTGMQEVADAIASSMVTTVDVAGVQNYMAPVGSEVEPSDLAGGSKFIPFNPNPDAPDGGRPFLLASPQIPKEHMEVYRMMVDGMERVSGVNSVTRGSPEANVKAGNFAALLQAQSAQFVSGASKQRKRLIQDTYMGILAFIRHFAKDSKRVYEVMGEGQSGEMMSYYGKQLAGVARVQVDVGNSMTSGPAGRKMIADEMAKQGWATREQWLEVLFTGRLTPVYKATLAESKLINYENDAIARGEDVPVLPTDNDLLHLREHGFVLANPANRSNPAVVQSALRHLELHNVQMQKKMGGGAPPVHGTEAPVEPGAAPPSPAPGSPSAKGRGPIGLEKPASAERAGVKMPQQAEPPAGSER